MPDIRHVVFRCEEEEGDFTLLVDGKEIATVNREEMDISNRSLLPLWQALGIDIVFIEEE